MQHYGDQVVNVNPSGVAKMGKKPQVNGYIFHINSLLQALLLYAFLYYTRYYITFIIYFFLIASFRSSSTLYSKALHNIDGK